MADLGVLLIKLQHGLVDHATSEERFRLNMSRAMAEIPIGSFILQMLPEHVMPRDDKKLMLLLVKTIQATTGSVISPVIQKRIDWTTIVDTSDGNIVWNRPSILPEEPYPAPFAVSIRTNLPDDRSRLALCNCWQIRPVELGRPATGSYVCPEYLS